MGGFGRPINMKKEKDTKLIVFQPWVDAKEQFEKRGVVKIKVKKPPCENCVSFEPRVVTDQQGKYSGVVLCNRIGGMANDFSCFSQRGLEEKEHTTFTLSEHELASIPATSKAKH